MEIDTTIEKDSNQAADVPGGTAGKPATGGEEEVPPRRFLTPGRTLALIFVFALAIRIIAALTRPMIQLDETAYVRMAENLVNSHNFLDISGLTAVHFSPLLPLFIAGLGAALRNYVFAAYVIVVVFGALITIPTYLLGKELVSERVGLMAAALISVTPLFVDYGSRIYTESVYIFFLMMGLVFGRHMLRGCRIPCGTLAGASLGLAYVANPSGAYYMVAIVALAIVVGLVRGIWRQMGKALIIFLAFFLIYATPYLIFLHSEMGRWAYNGKISSGNIYASTHDLRANTIPWDQDMLSLNSDNTQIKALTLPDDDPLGFALHQPLTAAKVFARQSFIFYTDELPRTFPLWLLPLMGLGLFAAGWTRRRLAAIGYLVVMMLPAALILAMYAHDRFFMPFVPLVMIWVAEGWSRLHEWGRDTLAYSVRGPWQARLHRWMPWLIGAAVLVPMLVYSAGVIKKESYPTGYRDAGQAIERDFGSGYRVMSREYSAAYYSGSTAVLLPYSEYDRTTEYAHNQTADFLVIGKNEMRDWRPTLTQLLDDPSQHPEWQLVEDVDQGGSQETLVFKLVG